MDRRKFAFLLHPRVCVREDFGLGCYPLKYIPDAVYNWTMRTLPVPPVTWGKVFLADRSDEPSGWLLMVPLGARQMLEMRRDFVLQKIEATLDKAAALGAEVVGLGALTAPITKGGQKLRHRTDLGITNGNAFTAAMTYKAVERILATFGRSEPEVAIVGASGSVGSCVVSLMARHRSASRLTLVARSQPRLEDLADTARSQAPDVCIRTTKDISAVRTADLVVLLTSSTDCLLRSEHLKPGAIVLDDTQPRNTDPALLTTRPDVRVIDGGLVSVPGMRITNNIALPRGYAYACLAETMLLALEGHTDHFSIGTPTLEQADYMLHLANTHRRFGFDLAPFHSFGQPLPENWTWSHPVTGVSSDSLKLSLEAAALC